MSSLRRMTDLHDLTALEQGAAIRSGETSTAELVEHYLERIDRLSDEMGAFVTVTGDARPQHPGAGRRCAGRRTHRDQGPEPDGRGADGVRVTGVRRLRAGGRRRGGAPHQRRWPGQPGQDEHAGVRLALLHRARGPAPGSHTVGHHADGRRLQRWRGRRGRRRAGTRGPGLGRRRLDPDPGQLLRTGRPQADAGPDLRRPDVRRPGRSGHRRADRPHRPRRGGVPRRDGRPRGRRPDLGARAAPGPSSTPATASRDGYASRASSSR